jgi:hypothetical protein
MIPGGYHRERAGQSFENETHILFSETALCRQKVMVRNMPPTTLTKSHAVFTPEGEALATKSLLFKMVVMV